MIAGLRAMPRLIIQSMIVTGPVQNVEGEAHETWLKALVYLAPQRVQIYSAERPVAETGVERVPKQVLKRLARKAEQRTGVSVTAY
jgi:wyosine [tRNA(Phe)-imidazoG37] synthetase (radical SAM superfamily)